MTNETLNDGVKLYSPIYAVIDWVHDECVNGEHEQTCGEHVIKVVKVLGADRLPHYKAVSMDCVHFISEYDEACTMECIEDGCFSVRKKAWSYRENKTQEQINQENIEAQMYKHIRIKDKNAVCNEPIEFSF